MSWIYSALLGTAPQNVQIVPGSSAAAAAAPPPPYNPDSKPRVSPPAVPLSLPALDLLRTKRFVLASGSPRRLQILQRLALPNLEVVPSSFAEDLDKGHYTPWEYVLETATRKCQEVYRREIARTDGVEEPLLVLAADTVVCLGSGEVLEKPAGDGEHWEMLKKMRDQGIHKVYTAIVAMSPLEEVRHPGYAMKQHVEETIVHFDKTVTDELLLSYVRTREGSDKAGGYAIQGAGGILVERVEGSYDNVVGLPLRATLRMIEKVLGGDDDIEEDEEEAVKI